MRQSTWWFLLCNVKTWVNEFALAAWAPARMREWDLGTKAAVRSVSVFEQPNSCQLGLEHYRIPEIGSQKTAMIVFQPPKTHCLQSISSLSSLHKKFWQRCRVSLLLRERLFHQCRRFFTFSKLLFLSLPFFAVTRLCSYSLMMMLKCQKKSKL